MLKSLLSSWSCEDDNKQISSGRTNHNTFLVIFKGIVVKLKRFAQLFQVSIGIYPHHPLQQTTRNSCSAYI